MQFGTELIYLSFAVIAISDCLNAKIQVSPLIFVLLQKIKINMRIDIITVLPEMIEGFFNCSIMKRAQNKGLAEIHIHNLRDYTEDKYRRVDDYPFGGFAGMVMKIEPIERCINALKAEREYDEVIFTTPDGEQFNQPMANTLSLAQNLIILAGILKVSIIVFASI